MTKTKKVYLVAISGYDKNVKVERRTVKGFERAGHRSYNPGLFSLRRLERLTHEYATSAIVSIGDIYVYIRNRKTN